MKHLLTILYLTLISILCNLQSQAQCHIDDWTALKALYESTNGDNWTDNSGWEVVKESTPPTGCDLSLLFGIGLDNEGRVRFIILYKFDFEGNNLTGIIPPELSYLTNLKQLVLVKNQLIGNIPIEIGNLNMLTKLHLEGNQLTGNIPTELGDLTELIELTLTHNQLEGNIPPELSNLGKLRQLNLCSNQLTGSIPTELGDLTELIKLLLSNNQLEGNIPPELSNLVKLRQLWLQSNQLTGNIPFEFGDLTELKYLFLRNNKLTGNMPPELSNLAKLEYLSLSNNQLTGNIPLSNPNWNNFTVTGQTIIKRVYLEENYFTCENIQTYYEQSQRILEEVQQNLEIQVTIKNSYEPQYFTPVNYENIVSQVFDTINANQPYQLKIEFPFDSVGLTYQWFRNGNPISGATQPTLHINSLQPKNAGLYTLHTCNANCLPNNSVFELISDPMYIIIKGYDLYGQPIEYNQIMVQFDSPKETKKYENEILSPNAGWVKKTCNCNRELYLWQFPTTEAAVAALLEIDRKKKRIKSKNKPKGGFNNTINIGETTKIPVAYIVSDAFNQTYPDSATIFLLDSGLDEEQDKFSLNEAPIDSCYNIEKAKGYSYVDSITTVSTNYVDELWHGTFGYNSITQNLKDESAIKIVPLKIFDKNGKGNLFDMVCAMYHAIDHNADVINISAGYYGEPSDILESAINEAREKGVFITAAAGNDTINIDKQPQYPAYYASQYNVNNEGIKDSVKYDNVISIASIDAQNQLSQFSNFGKQSATIACYGENIHSYGIDGLDVVASGTSMSTFLASKALALEIAKDKQRDYQQIWKDFETNWLVNNSSLLDVTQTSKQINYNIEEAVIKGCTNPNSINYFPFATEDDGTCEITNIEDRVIGFEMYPNPSNGMVQLAFNKHVNLVKQISVIDCLGKSVLAINSSDEIIQIQLDAFAKGIYFIRINIAEKTIIQKLVLK